MEEGLALIGQSARGAGKGKLMDAIKTQMAFRRKVLHQAVHDTKDWVYSQNGSMHDVTELSTKLKTIITQVQTSNR